VTLATTRRCLVLNSDYTPLSTYPLSIVSGQEAVRAVYRGRAFVVDEWPETFRSPSTEIHVPKVVALHEYAPINATPKFCRRNILLRDRYRCQYCGQRFSSHDLTFEHVVPRTMGGKTTWENILTACVPCNTKKGSRPANWSGSRGGGMRPLKVPRQPTTVQLLRAGLEFLDPVTKETWASWLYWSAELKA
jgi:5-methylcytosine-specific restriction endonuclease McrA